MVLCSTSLLMWRQVIYGIACDVDMKPHELGRGGAVMNGAFKER